MGSVSLPDAPQTFDEFLQHEQSKDLLRFTTAGSVDDGKSTLIGRLLYDSRSVYEDQLESVTKASAGRNAGAIDFSLLTDGLRAEREQGITIDVAYRYFATPKRKFIIADTPGHEQYTRNMVTGASTAELAIVLVDARKGLLPQSRRHAYISALLGLSHLVIAVNKMDLVDYREDVFAQIEQDFRTFLLPFGHIEPFFVPISALVGDNIVSPSRNMAWFTGPTLLHHLETVPVGERTLHASFRFPVQRVVRPDLDFRGYAGTVAAGQIKLGDPVVVLPSGRTTTVERIATFDGNLPLASAGQAVTLTLKDEVDVSRGDTIASATGIRPQVSSGVIATVVWLNSEGAELNKRYRLKHATALQSADLKEIRFRTNINSLAEEPAETLEMNAVGSVVVETARPLVFDHYEDNRTTGSFILIDPVSNGTVAAGLITGNAKKQVGTEKPTEVHPVSRQERNQRYGHDGGVLTLSSDQAETAWRLERALFDSGCNVFFLPEALGASGAAIAQLGTLVILVEPTQAPNSVHFKKPGETTDTLLTEMLPSDSGQAVQAVELWLGRLQIIRADANWSDRGGI